MTQKEKELLLKDLSARLPYQVKALNTSEGLNQVGIFDSVLMSIKYPENIFVGITLTDDSIMTGIENIKPYLRPMSSMTDEERGDINIIVEDFGSKWMNAETDEGCWDALLCESNEIFAYCMERHLDINNLIPKGLALEAPEGMYKTNEL